MDAADSIIADIMKRHERNLGAGAFGQFLADLRVVIDHQRAATTGDTSQAGPGRLQSEIYWATTEVKFR